MPQIKDGRNMRFVLDDAGRLTGYLDEQDQVQPLGLVYAEDLQGDTPENVLIRKASAAVRSEAQADAPAPVTDRILSLREAAHFLRQAALGGGTWPEIQRVFQLGSRRAWLAEQIHVPEAARVYPAWTGADESVEAAGWFGTIARRLVPPRNRTTAGQYPAFSYPGWQTTSRILNTAFMANASESPNRKFYDPSETVRIKATWVLSKFIPCSIPGGGWDADDKALPIAGWYSMLHRYAFRNYADLLEAVTYHPSMSRMLTYAANEKQTGDKHPDENYAREIMQLFTIGLYELNIDGTEKLDASGRRLQTYNNDDIREMAKVFTGLCRWDLPDGYYTDPARAGSMRDIGGYQTYETLHFYDGIANVPVSGSTYQSTAAGVNPRLRHYMPFYETGEKRALGGRVSIPAGTDPRTNIKMAIRALVAHPSCAPFVSKNLIKLTITSNPSPGYVARVARVFENDGTGVRGNLAAVWEAILTDPEAANTVHTSATHGRVRDGFELFVNAVRPLYRESAIPTTADVIADSNTNHAVWIDQAHQTGTTTGLVHMNPRNADFGAWPMYAPSIFGYYPPEYSQAPLSNWGLVIPEMGAVSATIAVRAANELRILVIDREPRDAAGALNLRCLDYAAMLPVTGTAAELVERLNLLFCGGTLTPKKAEDIISVISAMPVSTTDEQQNRIGVALGLINYSTEYWVM